MTDGPMQFLYEANGWRWYFAAPGKFERPGLYFWDGKTNIHIDDVLEDDSHPFLTAVMVQRDMYCDIADGLAERIAKLTDAEIGEHSSNNDPWMNAKYAADEAILDKMCKMDKEQ